MAITPCRQKWAGTLTDRERFNRQMHYQSVDRCFNMEFGYWKENFTAWPLFYENGITNNQEADKFFNFDIIQNVWGPTGLMPSFEHKVLEKTETTKIIQNHLGLIAEVPLDDHDTIPHYIKSAIVTPDDWKRCKEERLRRDDPGRIVDIEQLKKQHPADRDYPLGVYCASMIGGVRDILTFEGLAYATFDYPDMVEDMVETNCLMVEDFLDQVLGVEKIYPHVHQAVIRISGQSARFGGFFLETDHLPVVVHLQNTKLLGTLAGHHGSTEAHGPFMAGMKMQQGAVIHLVDVVA